MEVPRRAVDCHHWRGPLNRIRLLRTAISDVTAARTYESIREYGLGCAFDDLLDGN